MANTSGHPEKLTPVHLVREKKGAKGARLWLKEPESQAEDSSLLAARLCSCSDVCLAVIEDRNA
ncbi:MAG TPA: hypothetical protein VH394_31565 [Thermoanaerobaculia bacterium]|jgi:hypothetical protein|nr:hypothetical protein [Thermoanaerobaculia bacterium]